MGGGGSLLLVLSCCASCFLAKPACLRGDWLGFVYIVFGARMRTHTHTHRHTHTRTWLLCLLETRLTPSTCDTRHPEASLKIVGPGSRFRPTPATSGSLFGLSPSLSTRVELVLSIAKCFHGPPPPAARPPCILHTRCMPSLLSLFFFFWLPDNEKNNDQKDGRRGWHGCCQRLGRGDGRRGGRRGRGGRRCGCGWCCHWRRWGGVGSRQWRARRGLEGADGVVVFAGRGAQVGADGDAAGRDCPIPFSYRRFVASLCVRAWVRRPCAFVYDSPDRVNARWKAKWVGGLCRHGRPSRGWFVFCYAAM